MPRHTAPLVAIALLVGACFSTPAPSAPSVAERRPIIVDTDLDHSDIAALLVLLRDPAVDVRAIAISGSGLIHCQGGRLVTRYLLDEMGVPDIPFGCGREEGGSDARPFPDDWRAVADRGYGLDMTPKVENGVPRDAVEILTAAIRSSPTPPLLVTLGPLTNLEDAFLADPTLVDGVTGVHAMLATIDAPGNVFVDGLDGDDPLEWNAFADPSAVAAVLATDLPVDLVPLDATRDVPVPADLLQHLADDHAAAGADLLYELLIRHPARLRADEGQELWDELAALAVTAPGLVTWEEATVMVGDDGRLKRDAGGRPVRFASRADRAAVEAALGNALRRGGPRLTPFQLSGAATVAWDGTACTMTGEPASVGLYTLSFENTSGKASGVTVAGVTEAHTWADLTALLETIDMASVTAIPDWVVTDASINDEQGSGVDTTTTMTIGDLTYGPVCVTGVWPDLEFTPGTSFVAGS